MRSFKKLLLAAATTMVLAAGVAVSPASATVPTEGKFNAQANVPYLAWRGEHLRLGYCSPTGVDYSSDTVTWLVEEWSGDPANGSIPVPLEITGARHFSSNGCVYTDYVSQKAGVAFIKLEVNNSETGAAIVDKFFLAAWMQIQGPVLTPIGSTDVTAGDINCEVSNLVRSASYVHDVTDPSRFCPLGYDPRHLVKAQIKGIIPLKANFPEWDFSDPLYPLVTPGQITLPDDWAAWAHVAANDKIDKPNTIVGNLATTNWDIHDSQLSAADTHVISSPPQCDVEVNPTGTTDTVDNCPLTPQGSLVPVFGGIDGSFSTVFGVLSENKASDGPFDPLYTNATMLSDGIVDVGDAPMPAAQIDIDIAEPSVANPKGGAGYLLATAKEEVYSRDSKGTLAAHNYDSPFYQQYLPATSRPIDTAGTPYGAGTEPTGVDGAVDNGLNPGQGGFSGFLNNNGAGGLYHNWDFAWESTYHPQTDSQCLDYQTVFKSFTAHYRPLPYGDSSVSAYSDEHGEADFWYVPGYGFYFPATKGISNGKCDLRNIDPLGNAQITVTARYPYQPVTISDPHATLAFTVHSKWAKTLQEFPKGGTDDAFTRVVVAHAQDIDGNPLQHETVCWTSNQLNSIAAFPSGPGGAIYASYLPDGTPVGDPVLTIDPAWAQDPSHSFINGLGQFCTTTDVNGNTAVEFSESNAVNVDVVAHFANEAIDRDIHVIFTSTDSTGPQLSDTGPVVHVPTPTQIKAAAAATAAGTVGPVLADGSKPKTKVIKSVKVKKPLHKISLARVHKPFHGKRVLQVKVTGKTGMVALRITIKLGKTTHTFKRFVPANKFVAVNNLPIPVKTAKVTVSLLGL